MNFADLYKTKLTDAVQAVKPAKNKALLVDLVASVSGKVTNGRVYTPKAHAKSVDSWTKPYGKALIKDHAALSDNIVGRVVSAKWVATDDEALAFLKGNRAALADIKRAYDAGSPSRIYKVMKKYDAFNPAWPGLGKVVVTGRVPKVEHQENFLDGTWFTYSAGQSTDSYKCMICDSDRLTGEACEHTPGLMTESGDVAYYMCGDMSPREVSVVVDPANDTSITLNMSFEDSKAVQVVTDSFQITASNVSLEKEMKLEDLMQLDLVSLASTLAEGNNAELLADSFEAESQFEIGWLIKIHDALHYSYDFDLKYGDKGEVRFPMGVFKLHGVIHDQSMKLNFRDSIVNGHLDHYDQMGAESEEYVYKMPGSSMDDAFASLKADLLDALKVTEPVVEKALAVVETPAEVVVVADATVVEKPAVELDWELLDLALEAELRRNSVELTLEEKTALEDSVFCGPSRLFPVLDSKYVKAAKAVAELQKNPEAKAELLKVINSKAVSEDCACKRPCGKCADAEALKTDYASALVKIEALQGQLLDLAKPLNDVFHLVDEFSSEKLDSVLAQVHTLDVSRVIYKHPLELSATAAPEIALTDHQVTPSQENKFAMEVAKRYKMKLAEDKELADAYLESQTEFLPDDFQISKYL